MCNPIHTLYEGKCVRGRDTKIVFCSTCGYAHVYPKPTEEEMAEYYKSAYYQAEKPAYSADQDRIGEYLDVVNQEKLLALGPGRFGMRQALDVGCGRETRWVECLRRAGYEPVGMDPSVPGGITPDIYPSWEAWREATKYDDPPVVISLNFVLEHVIDPATLLRTCCDEIHDDGRLLVEVPNDFTDRQRGIWKRRGGEIPWWVSTPDHLNYYTPSSLQMLLHSCGFHMEIMRSTWPIESLLDAHKNYLKDTEAREYAVLIRAQKQKDWWGKGLSAHDSGRTLWCVARKA